MDTAMETSMWKEEPLSPGFSGLESEEAADLWLFFEEDVAKQAHNAISTKNEPLEELGHSEVSIWLPESPDISHDYTSLANRGQLASQILQSLDNEFIKEEPFSDWLEQKVDLPIFEELPSPSKEEARPFALLQTPPVQVQVQAPVQQHFAFTPAPPAPAAVLVPLTTLAALHQVAPLTQSVPVVSLTPPVDTQSLLQEFECVFDKVEQSHGALTPPQSPPHGATSPPHTFHRLAPAAPPLHEDFSTDPLTPNPQAIAELDEIVRNRVAESWGDTSFRPPSPCTSSSSSFSENSPETPATPESSCTDDPEWIPEPASPAAPAPGKTRSRKRGGSKPYGGNTVEDKRLRKKEQNKNAATRYRMKKKAEVEEILGEEQELKDTNTQLKSKVADLSQEIRYLKNLMRDVCRAKGLIK